MFKLASTFTLSFALSSVIFTSVSLAQAVVGEPVTPDLASLVQMSLQIFTDWKAGGAIVGLIAIVNLLTNLTKFPYVDKLLQGKFWLRPVISAVLGTAAALLGALASGVPVLPAVLTGLLAGITSTGLHELVTSLNSRVQTERSTGSVIVQALSVTSSEEAKKQIEPIKVELDRIALIAVPDERRKALADWANANPPKAV